MGILNYAGVLDAHKDWVTCMDIKGDVLVSGSRDKRLIAWDLTATENGEVGRAKKSMTGHSHFVSDLAIAQNTDNLVISSSWDNTLRLWNYESGESLRRYVGHTRDVQTVCLNKDEKRIYSGASDNLVRVWNVEGKEIGRTDSKSLAHRDWVSCVRTIIVDGEEYVVASGWDRTVRIWKATDAAGLTGKATVLVGPEGVVTKIATMNNTIVAISKDGSIRRITVSTDGDKIVASEEVIETEYKNMYDVVMHPSGAAAFVAADKKILVVDLTTLTVISEEAVQNEEGITKSPRSLAIDNGSRLFVGETLGSILVFDIEQQ